MLTQEEINAIREGLVTKDDLKKLVTKPDLTVLERNLIQKFNDRFDVLEEKIDGVLEFAENIEKERDANEKRLLKIESVLNV